MVSQPVSAWPLVFCLFYTLLKAAAVCAASDDSKLHYYDSFDPALIPWAPAQERNIEEVFKRYEYYAIVYSDDDARLTVSRYRKGLLTAVTHWRRQPDGALVVYDAASLEEVKRIPMRKPLGKYNVYNKINRSAGTSH